MLGIPFEQEQPMQISILDRQNLLTPDAKEFAERRLLFALSRFDSRIDRVSLVVADANGPRGGIDKACSVTVKLRSLPEVRVTSEDANVEAGIAHVADRVGRAVARAIERSQQFDRRRPQIL
jgi:ribosome-associated translation inhibitor RaiA